MKHDISSPPVRLVVMIAEFYKEGYQRSCLKSSFGVVTGAMPKFSTR